MQLYDKERMIGLRESDQEKYAVIVPAPFMVAVVVMRRVLEMWMDPVLDVQCEKRWPIAGVAEIVMLDPALNHPLLGEAVPEPLTVMVT